MNRYKSYKELRELIACPEFGDDHYGKWGALPYEMRQEILFLINDLDYYKKLVDAFERNEIPHKVNKQTLEMVTNSFIRSRKKPKSNKLLVVVYDILSKIYFENKLKRDDVLFYTMGDEPINMIYQMEYKEVLFVRLPNGKYWVEKLNKLIDRELYGDLIEKEAR